MGICIAIEIVVLSPRRDVTQMSKQLLTFDQIALSKREYRLLKKTSKHKIALSTCPRLKELGLIDEIFDPVSGYMPHATGYAQINKNGINYLAYKRDIETKTRKEHTHNWLIAIFSVVAGALLSKPLWSLIEAIQIVLFDRLQ